MQCPALTLGLTLLLAHGLSLQSGAAQEIISLWDGSPPLAIAASKAEEALSPGEGNPDIVRIGHVSEPTLAIYPAPKENRTGTAVLICPGGGYSIVAYKHEGTQVAEWLNSIGITAAVLKYRVPAPPNEPPHLRPLLDAQRAMSLLRSRGNEWDLRPDRIGVLGFSAGGHLAAWLLCEGNRRPDAYPIPGDALCRPDFGILIYPAYLAELSRNRLAPVIRDEAKPGPVFFVHAADDRLGPENSIEFFLALKKAGVGAELHVFQQGGHGFGMLKRGHPIHDWPKRAEEWLRAQSF